MPIDPVSIATSATMQGMQNLNSILQGVQNRKNRRWAEKRYNIERADALHDWHMQNAYNSPEQQMQRLKAAGLNPHLVYGSGSVANNAGGVDRTSSVSAEGKFLPMQPEMMAYHDASVKQAQTDNLQAQISTAGEQQKLLAAQTLATLMNTKTSELDYNTKKELQQYQFEAARLGNRKLEQEIHSSQQNIAIALNEEMRKQNLHPVTVQKLNEEVNNLKEQRNLSVNQRQEIQHRIQNMVKDGTLKDWEIELSKKGIRPSDPLWQRKVTEMLNEAKKPIKAFIKGEGKWVPKSQPKNFQEWLDRFSPY